MSKDRTPEIAVELRVFFEAILQERDVRYQERFEAQQNALKDALVAVDKSTSAAFVAADRATTKAEAAADKRFESVNAFRAQLADQAATFLTRNEYDTKNTALTERFEAMDKVANDKIDQLGRTMETRITAVIGSISQVASRIDRNDGRSTGLNAGWGYLVGAIGMVAAVGSVLLAVLLH